MLKTWMGHTDIHITLDTYADVFSRMNAGAVEMLDAKMKDIVPRLYESGQLRELAEKKTK